MLRLFDLRSSLVVVYVLLLGLIYTASSMDFTAIKAAGFFLVLAVLTLLILNTNHGPVNVASLPVRVCGTLLFIGFGIASVRAAISLGDEAEVSTTMFLTLFILPLAFILTSRKLSSEDRFGYFPPCLLGMALLVLISYLTLPTPFGPVFTAKGYGTEAVTETIGVLSARFSLPYFPGILSGGVFCTVGTWGSLTLFATLRQSGYKTKLMAVALTVIFFSGIVLTDFRLGYLVFAGGVVLTILKWRPLFGLSRYYFRIPFLVIIFCFPLYYSLFIPYLSDAISAFPDLPSRQEKDDPLFLNGRVLFWENGEIMFSDKLTLLVGAGFKGEVTMGIDQLFVQNWFGYIPSFATGINHFHNMTLNIFATGGIILVVLLFLAVERALALALSSRDLPSTPFCYSAMLIALLLCGLTESIFAINYIYFIPLLGILLSPAYCYRNMEELHPSL